MGAGEGPDAVGRRRIRTVSATVSESEASAALLEQDGGNAVETLDRDGGRGHGDRREAPSDTGSDAPAKRTPLPLPQIATLWVLLFANAAVSTAPFPFLPFMVQDLGATVEQTGSAVGLIAGGRFFGNLLGSWVWGIAADRFGRRPCILLSLAAQCVCTLGFAYSTALSVPCAAAARTIGGMLNGAVPIVKTYVSEITDSTNQGLAMTIITASWGAGLVIGPALGGFLSDPASKYPQLDTPLLRAYPYALPMVVVTGLCVVSTVLGWLFLGETLDPKKIEAARLEAAKMAEAEAAGAGDGRLAGASKGTSWPSWLPVLLRDRTRFTVVLLYATLSVQAIGFDEMYNVFLATPAAADGMGMTTNTIGSTLVVYGITQIFLTAPAFQALEPRLGMVPLFKCMALVTACGYLCVPLVPRVMLSLGYARNSVATWWALVATVVFAKLANGICFVLQAVFTNNSVSQVQRGAMNGLSMTVAAAVRSVTPLVFGWIFGVTISAGMPWPFDVTLVFTLVAVVMVHTAHVSTWLPESLAKNHE